MLIVMSIALVVFLLSKCVNEPGKEVAKDKDDGFKKYAGSAACATCHKDIYDNNIHTEHYLTSGVATGKNISGSFESGKNTFAFDLLTKVVMEKRDSGFYQVQYTNGTEYKKGRFDIVVGSGRKGQSYLSWLHDRLVQLPITYFTPAGQWSNSPGYPLDMVAFYRPITSRCLECHSTYFKKTGEIDNRFENFDHEQNNLWSRLRKMSWPCSRSCRVSNKKPRSKRSEIYCQPGKASTGTSCWIFVRYAMAEDLKN